MIGLATYNVFLPHQRECLYHANSMKGRFNRTGRLGWSIPKFCHYKSNYELQSETGSILSILDKQNSFQTGLKYFPSLYTFYLYFYVIIFRRQSFHKLSNEGYWNLYKRTNRNLDDMNIDKFILLSWFDIFQLLVLFMKLIGNYFLEIYVRIDELPCLLLIGK